MIGKRQKEEVFSLICRFVCLFVQSSDANVMGK